MTDVHRLTLQLRPPRGKDGGKVEIGFWCVADQHVVLCDENGRPIGDKRLLNQGEDPKLVALAMMKSRRRNGSAPHGFNDRLVYQKLKY